MLTHSDGSKARKALHQHPYTLENALAMRCSVRRPATSADHMKQLTPTDRQEAGRQIEDAGKKSGLAESPPTKFQSFLSVS